MVDNFLGHPDVESEFHLISELESQSIFNKSETEYEIKSESKSETEPEWESKSETESRSGTEEES